MKTSTVAVLKTHPQTVLADIARLMSLAGLEQAPRDAYTGSMGYLGRDGTLDLNILIRTLTLRDDTVGFRTGAGIVADSHPEAELAETRAKARGLLRALGSET